MNDDPMFAEFDEETPRDPRFYLELDAIQEESSLSEAYPSLVGIFVGKPITQSEINGVLRMARERDELRHQVALLETRLSLHANQRNHLMALLSDWLVTLQENGTPSVERVLAALQQLRGVLSPDKEPLVPALPE